eukprot:scaffold314128_cov32-Tisochrysis_lutea.AAC.2
MNGDGCGEAHLDGCRRGHHATAQGLKPMALPCDRTGQVNAQQAHNEAHLSPLRRGRLGSERLHAGSHRFHGGVRLFNVVIQVVKDDCLVLQFCSQVPGQRLDSLDTLPKYIERLILFL